MWGGSCTRVCEDELVSILVNNAGVAHYKPLAELLADQARELARIKALAPTLLMRAVVGGMFHRGEGTIIDLVGMIAFSGQRPSR